MKTNESISQRKWSEFLFKKITAIFVLGLMVRVLSFLFLPFDPNKYSDSVAYLNIGQELLRGGLETNNVMPLFPLLTAVLGSPVNTIYFNILLSSLTVLLVYRLTKLIFNKECVALLSALMMAVYPYSIFYSLTIMTETLYIFLILLSFNLLFRKNFAGASVFLALSVLTKPVADPLIPVLVFVFAWIVFKMRTKDVLKKMLLYFFIYSLMMTPWWTYNYRKFNQFQRLNPTFGGAFYTGNNINFINYELTRDSVSMEKLINDCSRFDKIPNVVLRNDALLNAALDNIKNNPKQYLKLLGAKFIIFWRIYPSGEYHRYAWVALATYGVALMFFLYFILFLWRPFWRLILPIVLFIAYFTVVHVVLIPSVRYRMPCDPFIIILASYALVECFSKVSRFKKI
jgi:4-amino-4-deoxy-L-arabinose transferase-like glycosyltransferase